MILTIYSLFQDVTEVDMKPVIGHGTGATEELDVEDLYTKYKVRTLFMFCAVLIATSFCQFNDKL